MDDTFLNLCLRITYRNSLCKAALGGVPFGTSETPAEAKEVFQAIRAAVGEALGDSAGNNPELRDRADMVWATVHGFIVLSQSGRIAEGKERAAGLVHAVVADLLRAWRKKD
ncbi:TetR-like C-terminal domain-containing protein [Brevibacillus borstelensis]|uniref:TetR-like C-terminal domain-containing protein n=1 Tax=Brevibacillus borstelensis TaxID=45462 RepID=UPI003CC9131A